MATSYRDAKYYDRISRERNGTVIKRPSYRGAHLKAPKIKLPAMPKPPRGNRTQKSDGSRRYTANRPGRHICVKDGDTIKPIYKPLKNTLA